MHAPLRRRLRLARRWAAYLLAVVLVLSTWIGMAVSALFLRWLMRHAEPAGGE